MNILIIDSLNKTIKKYNVYTYDIIRGAYNQEIYKTLDKILSRVNKKQGSLRQVNYIFDNKIIFIFDNIKIILKDLYYNEYSTIETYNKYSLYNYKLYNDKIIIKTIVSNKLFKQDTL